VRAMRAAAERAGLSEHSKLSGHSLRVGAAQELLLRGFDTVAIARAGGWRSIATLSRYLEPACERSAHSMGSFSLLLLHRLDGLKTFQLIAAKSNCVANEHNY